MKITKQLEKEIKALMDDYWNSYFTGDIKHWGKYLVNDYRNIGGTKEEIWNSKKEILDYTHAIIDQMVGQAEIRNKTMQIIPYDPYIMVHEFMDLHIKVSGKWTFYGKFRLSSLIQKTTKGWQVLHQHGSYPDSKTEEGEAFAFDEIKAENIKLKDAVKRRTLELEQKNRELEIETALEKVRAIAMGMKQPADMLEVCKTISGQLKQLGVKEIRNVQTAIINEINSTYLNYEYYTKHKKLLTTEVDYKNHKIQKKFAGQMLTGAEELFTETLKGKKLKDWYAYQQTTNQFVDKYLEQAESLNYYWYSLGPVALGISTYTSLTEDEINLFKRFRNVFELAYRRFIDIEQAMADAREAQIEATLERIRSRAMAMQTSDDLNALIGFVFTECTKLDLTLDRCIVIIVNPQTLDSIWILANPETPDSPSSYAVQYHEYPPYLAYLQAWKKREEKWHYLLGGAEKKKWDKYIFVKTALSQLPEPAKQGMKGLKEVHLNASFGNFGNLTLSSLEPLTTEQFDILIRVAKVFDSTYTRYNDLRQAEAQAKEAQIQLALERVRARTMAMQKSEELTETSFVLFEQFKALGESSDQVSIGIFDEVKNIMNLYSTLYGTQWKEAAKVNLDEPVVIKKIYAAWKNQKKSLVLDISGADLQKYNKYRKKLSGIDYKEKRWVIHIAFFSKGMLSFSSPEPHEAIQLLERFAGVFDGTYTRFLDLQKAEAQAREAKIEVSLERVRSRAMAMHKTDELLEAGELVYKELTGLGITSMAVSYAFVNEQEKNALYYGINPVDGKIPPVPFIFPHTETEVMRSILSSWKKQEAFKIIELNEDATLKHQTWAGKHLQAVLEKNKIPFSVEEFLAVSPLTAVMYAFNFTQGYIFIIGEERLTATQEEMVLRFTKVFEMTYRRFLDLQKAEEQAREAQIELGLERVRARAMAMHHSNELSQLVDTVFKELANLDFALNWCIINIIDEPSLTNMVWAANPETNMPPESYLMKFEDYPFHHSMLKGYQERKPKHVYVLEGKEKKDYDDYLFNKTEWRRVPKKAQAASRAMKRYVASFTFSNFGGLQTVGEEPLSKENLDILSRFGKVFDLTYTRFNDLQKAEAQAREAQIEAALERVRSRSLAMYKTDDLGEVVSVLFQQMQVLSVDMGFASVSIFIFEKDSGNMTQWIQLPDGVVSLRIPYFEHPISSDLFNAKASGVDYFSKVYTVEEKNTWVQKGFELTDYKNLPEEFKITLMDAPGYAMAIALAKNSGICIPSFVGRFPSTEDVEIMKRVGKVFEQAYTRFLDLQKAEAQAREAQIEAALERVRSQSMGMQTSKDLSNVTTAMFEQLRMLGGELFATGIVFCDKYENHVEQWHSLPDAGMISPFIVPVNLDYIHQYRYDQWKKGTELFSIEIPGDFIEQHFNDIFNLPSAQVVLKEFEANNTPMPATPPWEIDYGASFKHGYILASALQPFTEAAILPRFAKVFDQTYTRFLDLQKAEAQAREATIEAALEKVRSRSLAMHRPNELQEVVTVVGEKLQELGVILDIGGVVICTYFPDNKDVRHWTASFNPSHSSASYYLPYFDTPIWVETLRSKNSGADFFEKIFPFEVKNDFFNYAFEYSDYKNLPAEYKQALLEAESHALSFAWSKNSALMIASITGNLVPDEHKEILKRFVKVFEQAYIRFMDLQKAEAQAREAKIETALEKVRSRTMAMQHSDELPAAANLLFLEVQALGIPSWSSGYNILSDDKKSSTCIMSSEGQIQSAFHLPFSNSGEPSFAEWLKAIDTKQSFFVQELSGKAIDDHYNYMKSLPQVGQVLKELEDAGLSLPTYQINHLSFFNGGFLLFITYEQVPHAHDIFKRFTKVFEQTYTRFLDLQKAEAQAKEAQIEAALERVRSRSLAMHKSNELQEVIETVFDQILKLGILADVANFIIFNQQNKDVNCWIASPNLKINRSWHMPYTDIYPLNAIWIEKEKGNDSFSTTCSFEQKIAFFNWAFEHSDFKYFPDDRKQFVLESKCWTTSYAWVKHTGIQLSNYSQESFAENENEILKRFARVFEQSYIRFLDLQKAEAQTRQAHIETALERVRARALAMQEPEELKAVAEVLRHEMGLLGVEELETCSIYINDEQAEKAECWYALKDARSSEQKLVNDHFTLDLNDTWVGRSMLEFYNTPEKQISIVMQGANRKEWINYCEEKSIPFRGYYGEVIPDRTYHLYKFSHGAIGAAAAGDISTESWGLLKRAAAVFSLAYSRFKDLTQARIDLQRLKEEKKRAEDALTNLQAAQKQLVQSEKMASLGELTAGIAHEIQNPLNFVNNFSEVSKELLDEMNDELEKGNLDDVRDIMKDVIQNLEKINHHGKRADGIVKGMLQHSRSSSGVKEPTDINALADEYLRLTYHGLRAKDKSFNATMKTDFDPSLEKIDVIPQDIGRVILNLLTNAFYAVSEKKKQASEDYEPKVTIATSLIQPPSGGRSIAIKVSDNGGGIPQKIMDKIFQPFFTTKPTGQGTGLGLSLSYDIITKGHGGELKVETKEGKGSTFIILLPDNNN